MIKWSIVVAATVAVFITAAAVASTLYVSNGLRAEHEG